jgi:hypothetical protein
MRDKIIFATVSLHLSAFLYFLVGLGMLALFVFWLPFEHAASEMPQRRQLGTGQRDDVGLGIGLFMFLFCLALIVGIEVVAYGLERRKFWAWIAGLCIFGLYVPSLFFPLGAFGLWGLLDEGSRAEFGIQSQPRP